MAKVELSSTFRLPLLDLTGSASHGIAEYVRRQAA